MKKQTLKNKRACWIAKQYRIGWRLGLCIGNAKPTYVSYTFKDQPLIKHILRLPVVFVHMRGADA